MKYFLIFLCVLGFEFNVAAQQNHFLFIQSENKQVFNVTLKNQVYSSTATGYLIIPKLVSGNYSITIGFAPNTFADQNFNVQIADKDVGFNLKNFGEKGWGLFNLQTFASTMAGEAINSTTSIAPGELQFLPKTKAEEPVKKPVIERVVEKPKPADTTSVVKTEVKKPSETKAQEKMSATDSAPAKPAAEAKSAPPLVAPTAKTEEKAIVAKENLPVQNSPLTPVIAKSRVKKISEINGAEAIFITYVDNQPSANDTIQVLIPNIKVSTPEANTKATADVKFLDMNLGADTAGKTVSVPAELVNNGIDSEAKAVKKVNNCADAATEADFLKLRKKMAAKSDNDDMIKEAKAVFKTKCFTTLQVKNLSYLFLTDESRYQFFDAAYGYVSDPAIYNTLAKELTDTYYINRFKVMLTN